MKCLSLLSQNLPKNTVFMAVQQDPNFEYITWFVKQDESGDNENSYWDWNAGIVIFRYVLYKLLLSFVVINFIYALLHLHFDLMSVHFLHYSFAILDQAGGRGHLYTCMTIQMLLCLTTCWLYIQQALIIEYLLWWCIKHDQ